MNISKRKKKRDCKAAKLYKKAMKIVSNHPELEELIKHFGIKHLRKHGKALMEGYYTYGLMTFK